MRRILIVLGVGLGLIVNGCTGDYYSSDPYSGVSVGATIGPPAPYAYPGPYINPYPNYYWRGGFYNLPYNNFNEGYNTGHMSSGGSVQGPRRH